MRLRKLVLVALASSTLILTVGTVQAGPGKKKRNNSPMMDSTSEVMWVGQTTAMTPTTTSPITNQMNSMPTPTSTQMMPAMQTGQTNTMPYTNANSRRGNRGRRGMSNYRQPMSPMQPNGMMPMANGVQPAMNMAPIADGSTNVRPATNVVPTDSPDSQTRTANYLKATDPRAVRLKVTLPTADAKLFIQGQPMTPTGTERNFVSPPLELGRQYISTIRAVWTQAGAERVFERQVNVTPGQETTLRIE